MKNVSLFVVLTALLLVTYFVEEKKIFSTQKNDEEKLLDFKITSIETPSWTADLKDDQWYSHNQLLSHHKFKILWLKFSHLYRQKIIKGNWKQFSSTSDFAIKLNNKDFKIGDYSLDKKSRYIFWDGVIYLCRLGGDSYLYAKNESEIIRVKWNELTGILGQKLEQLRETQFFRYFPQLELSKVRISSNSFFKYELDFTENKTTPSPIVGVNVFPHLREKFTSLFHLITVKDFFMNVDISGDQLGEMIFFSSNGDFLLELELWQKEKDSAETIIWDKRSNRKFLVSGNTVKLFFSHVQDYWDRKVIPQSGFEDFNKTKVIFKEDDNRAEILLLNTEPLSFESQHYKVKKENMTQLFHYLLNLGRFDQADRVSILKPSDLNEEGAKLHVFIFHEEIIVWNKKNELIFMNKTRGFKAHFYVENVMTEFKDVLR